MGFRLSPGLKFFEKRKKQRKEGKKRKEMKYSVMVLSSGRGCQPLVKAEVIMGNGVGTGKVEVSIYMLSSEEVCPLSMVVKKRTSLTKYFIVSLYYLQAYQVSFPIVWVLYKGNRMRKGTMGSVTKLFPSLWK